MSGLGVLPRAGNTLEQRPLYISVDQPAPQARENFQLAAWPIQPFGHSAAHKGESLEEIVSYGAVYPINQYGGGDSTWHRKTANHVKTKQSSLGDTWSKRDAAPPQRWREEPPMMLDPNSERALDEMRWGLEKVTLASDDAL